MASHSFAGVDDYIARYGTSADLDRVAALLGDASAQLLAEYRHATGEDWAEGASALFDAAAPGVACAMVARALSSPGGMEGVTQVSQTGGPYTASVSFANPSGALWLSKSERSRLGLGGSRVWSICPMTDSDRG